MKKQVFITGVSSGIGLQTMMLLAKSDFFVIGSVRDQKKKEQTMKKIREAGITEHIDLVCFDVTNHEDVFMTMKQVIEKHHRIDILINNAGYCLGGFTEEITLEEWVAQFETNVFGAIAVTKSLLPHFRFNQSGRIIMISSVIGRVGLPSMAAYASSKFALKGFTDSLRLELLHTGIDVCAMELGAFQTKIWDKGLENLQKGRNKQYQKERQAINRVANKELANGKSPEEVAQTILNVCQKRRIKKQYVIGIRMKLFLFFLRITPNRWMEYYVRRAYKKEGR